MRDIPIPRPSRDLLGFLECYDPDIAELALEVRRVVYQEAGACTEFVCDTSYALAMGYSITGRARQQICHVALYRDHANIGFENGREMPDPDGLLLGAGKKIRHVRIDSPADLERPQVLGFLRMAIEHSRRVFGDGSNPRAGESVVSVRSLKKRRPLLPR